MASQAVSEARACPFSLSPSSPSHPLSPSAPSRRCGPGKTWREGSPLAPATYPGRGRGDTGAPVRVAGGEETAPVRTRWLRAPRGRPCQPRPGPCLPPAASRWSVDSLPLRGRLRRRSLAPSLARAISPSARVLSSALGADWGGSGDGSAPRGGRGSGWTCCPGRRHSSPEPSSVRPGTPGAREPAWRAPLPVSPEPGPGRPGLVPARPWAFVFLHTPWILIL